MTTKIHKLSKLYNMHLHKAKSIANKIDKYLPSTYTSTVIKRYEEAYEEEISSHRVKDVKRYKVKDSKILKIILELAGENEKSDKKLERLAKRN